MQEERPQEEQAEGEEAPRPEQPEQRRKNRKKARGKSTASDTAVINSATEGELLPRSSAPPDEMTASRVEPCLEVAAEKMGRHPEQLYSSSADEMQPQEVSASARPRKKKTRAWDKKVKITDPYYFDTDPYSHFRNTVYGIKSGTMSKMQCCGSVYLIYGSGSGSSLFCNIRIRIQAIL